MKPAEAIAGLLSKYTNIEDFVHDGVQFKTLVPWVAPKAYLHIVFPPASADLLRERTVGLRIPEVLREFYSQINGAILFSGALDLYGLLPDKYLFNRDDWRCRLPFDLAKRDRALAAGIGRAQSLLFWKLRL